MWCSILLTQASTRARRELLPKQRTANARSRSRCVSSFRRPVYISPPRRRGSGSFATSFPILSKKGTHDSVDILVSRFHDGPDDFGAVEQDLSRHPCQRR